MNNIEFIYNSIGKRKTSVAKVFITNGNGTFTVNNKSFNSFFVQNIEEKSYIEKPLILLKLLDKYNIYIYIHGGGISSQLSAICLAISKTLCKINPEYRKILNKNGLLHRDSRIKERRKYGLRKARKAPQYSKR